MRVLMSRHVLYPESDVSTGSTNSSARELKNNFFASDKNSFRKALKFFSFPP